MFNRSHDHQEAERYDDAIENVLKKLFSLYVLPTHLSDTGEHDEFSKDDPAKTCLSFLIPYDSVSNGCRYEAGFNELKTVLAAKNVELNCNNDPIMDEPLSPHDDQPIGHIDVTITAPNSIDTVIALNQILREEAQKRAVAEIGWGIARAQSHLANVFSGADLRRELDAAMDQMQSALRAREHQR
jgi:hypothetical protein